MGKDLRIISTPAHWHKSMERRALPDGRHYSAQQRLSRTDYRKQACRDQLWIPTAQQPLLPDKDAITTNAWSEAYNLSLKSPPEEEEERILWPRGVCAYSCICRAIYHI